MFDSILNFYDRHEWLRWLVFIPLFIIVQIVLSLLVSFINIDIANSIIYRCAFLPALLGYITIISIFILAPRYKSKLALIWVVILATNMILGVVNIIMQARGYSFEATAEAIVYFVSAFISYKKTKTKQAAYFFV